MRILHSCPSESFSGLEQYALELAIHQKSKGHAVYFIVAPHTELSSQVINAGLTVLEMPSAFSLSPFLLFLRYTKFFSKLRFDVAHIHSTQEIYNFVIIKVLAKIVGGSFKKSLLHCHLWVNHKKKDFWHKLIYMAIDEVWCSSGMAKKSLDENLPVPANKIKIVPYGRNIKKIKTEFFSKNEARTNLGLENLGTIWGCVSRIEKSKGIAEWLSGMKPLLEKSPNMSLVHIGGISPKNKEAISYFENLKSELKKWPAEVVERVRFLGHIPDSHRYLRAFDIYCLPSYQETFSLALLDAQLAGLPVVGSRSGGTPELVIEGETGWLFLPRDAKSLESASLKATGAIDRWEAMGDSASQRVEKEFGQEVIFQKILELYEQS